MHAYCYASGLIEFGRKIPDGALPVARGPAKVLRDFIEAVARHGYKTARVKGRLSKVPGTDCLLVPGVPEAPNQIAAVDALTAFRSWLRSRGSKLPRGVTI
jgi:hypothetical protein